jgi:hypothetical protein
MRLSCDRADGFNHFKAQWLIICTICFNINKILIFFSSQCIHVFHMILTINMISLKSINRLAVVMETQLVPCEVRIGYLYTCNLLWLKELIWKPWLRTWPHPRSRSREMTQVAQRSQVAGPPITQYDDRQSQCGRVCRAGLQVLTAPQPQTMPWNYFTMEDDFPWALITALCQETSLCRLLVYSTELAGTRGGVQKDRGLWFSEALFLAYWVTPGGSSNPPPTSLNSTPKAVLIVWRNSQLAWRGVPTELHSDEKRHESDSRKLGRYIQACWLNN